MVRTRHLVDPALLPVLDSFPPMEFTRAMLPDFRAMMDEMVAGLQPPIPDTILAEEHSIPGGDGQPMTIRSYRPRQAAGPLAAILQIHGGGYMFGNGLMGQPLNIANLQAMDCVVVSVDYRLAPETPFPGPLEDCFAALEWLAAQAGVWGIDLARIGVRGDSAGGGLAAGLALLARDRGGPKLRHLCLIAPMLDDRTGTIGEAHPYTGEYGWTASSNRFAWQCYLGREPGGDDTPPHASAARSRDLEGLPPTFICTGGLDLFLDEDMDFAGRLLRAGVPTELHVYAGVFHGAEMAQDTPVVQSMMRDVLAATVKELSSS